jgi:hypothetical protein
MKKILLVAAAAAGIAAYGTVANAAQQVITLQGTVSSFCTITAPASPGLLTPNFPTVTNGSVPADLTLDINIGKVTCNGGSTVTLSSAKGGAFTGTAAGDGFQNYVSYKAGVTVPATVNLVANKTAPRLTELSANSTTPTSADVIVKLTSIATTLPLVAGTYSDVLTVKIDAIP